MSPFCSLSFNTSLCVCVCVCGKREIELQSHTRISYVHTQTCQRIEKVVIRAVSRWQRNYAIMQKCWGSITWISSLRRSFGCVGQGVNNNILTLCNRFQNEGSIIICKIFPFKVLSSLPPLTLYCICSSLLRVFKLNTRFFSSESKQGKNKTHHTQIRALCSPGQRGVFWVPAELTTPGAATRLFAQIELTAAFSTERMKSWLAKNCVMSRLFILSKLSQ